MEVVVEPNETYIFDTGKLSQETCTLLQTAGNLSLVNYAATKFVAKCPIIIHYGDYGNLHVSVIES